MACACTKKWLVVNSKNRIVHRTDTQPKAEAVAARNPGDLRVLHQGQYDKERKERAAQAPRTAPRTTPTSSGQAKHRTARAPRAAAPTGGRPMYEVVSASGRVLQPAVANEAVAQRTADRFKGVGATVRLKTPQASGTSH